MGNATTGKPREDDGGGVGLRLLGAVRSISITPTDAAELVKSYRNRVRRASAKGGDGPAQPPNDGDPPLEEAEGAPEGGSDDDDRIADMIIDRYSKLAGLSGGVTGLAGVIPGVGTAIAALGGGLADTAICMKLQVDMCLCLSKVYRHDLPDIEAKDLALLLAAGTALEKAGAGAATQVASKAGVSMLRQYLKGAALQAIKELFQKIGIIFTRKAIEKALPFGVGVIVGGSADYALTKYVGSQAKKYFVIDVATPDSES
jgi:hypothetical protein